MKQIVWRVVVRDANDRTIFLRRYETLTLQDVLDSFYRDLDRMIGEGEVSYDWDDVVKVEIEQFSLKERSKRHVS